MNEKPKVIIEVKNGIVSIVSLPEGIDLEMRDYDTLDVGSDAIQFSSGQPYTRRTALPLA